jgi:beta-glucanase (GH16 family)
MIKYYWLLIFLIVISIGCNTNAHKIEYSDSSVLNAGSEKKDWQIIWQDSFDSSELDTSKWTRISPNTADWGKHMTIDSQCYDIADRKLYLKGIVNNDTLSEPRPFLTGGVSTKGKFSFQYGKIEIRAKLECADGAWPAMWMLPQENKFGSWPNSGEIDIMEHLNSDSIIYQTVHSNYTQVLGIKDNPPHGGTCSVDISVFNTYGMEWYPDKLVFTVNGRERFVYPKLKGANSSQWPYDEPFYILIDQQLGGSWVGKVNSDDLPVQMIVDWVIVYQ